MPDFDAQVRSHGEVAVVDLRGDLDGNAQTALQTAYAAATAATPRALVLNFAEVGYVNSTGIALIVGLLARARADATAVRVFGLSDHYRHIFEITRLADFMTFFSDEDEAVTEGTTAPA